MKDVGNYADWLMVIMITHYFQYKLLLLCNGLNHMTEHVAFMSLVQARSPRINLRARIKLLNFIQLLSCNILKLLLLSTFTSWWLY